MHLARGLASLVAALILSACAGGGDPTDYLAAGYWLWFPGADGTVSGCIGCIGELDIRRAHLYTLFGYRADQPLAQPTDYEVHFGRTRIGANGAFENPEATVCRPGRRPGDPLSQCEAARNGGAGSRVRTRWRKSASPVHARAAAVRAAAGVAPASA